jgi:hypothetical protein
MSETPSIVEVQLDELLRVVESYRDKSCTIIRERARAQAAEIVTQARHNARARMRTAIRQERARAQERIASTRAQLLTERRQRQQQTDKLLVERGWAKLNETLMRRWRDPDFRHLWIEALALQGFALLPVGSWRVEHPPGWDTGEMLGLGDNSAALPLRQSHTFVQDESITAGLRIEVDGACLDGTMEGLLANHASIEAQLLAEISRLRSES